MKLLGNNKTKTDCGVVAALNATRWYGIRCTYSKVLNLALASGYSPKKGIYFFQFSNLLKRMGVPAKRIYPKSSKAMAGRILRGNMLIVFYIPTGFDVGHVMSCILDHEGDIRVINPEGGERRTWIQLMRDIKANGMREFRIYEISPYKQRT